MSSIIPQPHGTLEGLIVIGRSLFSKSNRILKLFDRVPDAAESPAPAKMTRLREVRKTSRNASTSLEGAILLQMKVY